MEGEIIDAEFTDFDEEPSNKLQTIVQESGLEETKAKYILNKFQDYFTMADEWARQTKTIIVTNASQTDMMKLARVGRLALREKRLAVEASRKELKEQSLREGKAIDGIANVLKALIIPIEEYLEKQEKFVEFEDKRKAELVRIEVEKRIEEERIAKEKADAEEKERLRIENEKMRKESAEKERLLAEERKRVESARLEAERKARAEQDKIKREADAKLAEERKKAEAIRAEEKRKADAEALAIKKINEEKLAKERTEREKIEAELRFKKQAEQKAEAERIRKEQELASADDEVKLLAYRNEIGILLSKCPEVGPKSVRIIEDVKSHIHLAFMAIKLTDEQEDF